MKQISNAVKQTLSNLSKAAIDATPKEYEKEFCKVASDLNLSVNECKYFQDCLKQISDDEKFLYDKPIKSIYDIIYI